MIRFEDEEGGAAESPDMTPMIDMIFILLIFFLITSLLASPALRVTPPESQSAESSGIQKDLVIEMDSAGLYFYNDKQLSSRRLRKLLGKDLEEAADKTVYIRADKSVTFDLLVEGIDLANEAGAEEVGFLVEKP